MFILFEDLKFEDLKISGFVFRVSSFVFRVPRLGAEAFKL